MTRVVFVNGGILGLLRSTTSSPKRSPRQSAIDGTQLVLTENLSVLDRVIRRALCQRLWIDGILGLRNIDLARFRHELHAGLLARRRISAARARAVRRAPLPPAGHRVWEPRSDAHDSVDRLDRLHPGLRAPGRGVGRRARPRYGPNVRADGAIFASGRRGHCHLPLGEGDAAAGVYSGCRTPIHVLPNPVLLDYFDRRVDRGARRSRSRAGEPPRFLFIGGDFPRKGGHDLLEAWRAGGLHESGRRLRSSRTGRSTSRCPPA